MSRKPATWLELPAASPARSIRLQAGDGVTYRANAKPGCPVCRFEERARCWVRIHAPPDAKVEVWAGEERGAGELRALDEGEFLWTFGWGSYVGLSRLRVAVAGETVLDLPTEVYSEKIDYESDYRRLLDELTDWLSALVFSVATPTALPAATVAPERGSLYLIYLMLRRVMAHDRVPAAFEQVRLRPHRRLIREPRRVDFAQARQIDARTLADLVTRDDLARGRGALPPTVSRLLRGHAPTRLIDTRPRTDFDTPENRFVAHLLSALRRQLGHLERAFRRDAGEHPARAEMAHRLAEDCQRWSRQATRMDRASFLEDVGPMTVFPAASQVLRRRGGYRQLRDAYLQILLGPCVAWEGLEEQLRVPSRKVWQLYEYWCFFALADALARVTGDPPDWQNVIETRENVWEVRLQRGLTSKLRIGPIALWYNRGFRRPNSYSLPLRPDYTVEAAGRRWLFDAKYRLRWEDLSEVMDEEETEDREATFKQADIYKMHTYRDAVAGAEAVFIIYPGTEFRAFGADGERYESAEALLPGFAGVGAIPLRPEATAEMETVVRMLTAEAGTGN